LWATQGIDKAYSDLKETYQISILAQKSFFPDKNLTHTFQYYDPHACISLDGKIRIITLELEKSAAFIDKPAAGPPYCAPDWPHTALGASFLFR
jgi:hypothetical protein